MAASTNHQAKFFKDLYDRIQFMKEHMDTYELIARVEETISTEYVISIAYNHSIASEASDKFVSGWVYQFAKSSVNTLHTVYNYTGSPDRLRALELGIGYIIK